MLLLFIQFIVLIPPILQSGQFNDIEQETNYDSVSGDPVINTTEILMTGSMFEGESHRNMALLAVDCKLPLLSSRETNSVVEIEIFKLPPNQCFVLYQTYLKNKKPLLPDSLNYTRVETDRLPKLIATNATAKALHDNDPSPRPSPKPPQQPRPSPIPRQFQLNCVCKSRYWRILSFRLLYWIYRTTLNFIDFYLERFQA